MRDKWLWPLLGYAVCNVLAAAFSKYREYGFHGIMESQETVFVLTGYVILAVYAYCVMKESCGGNGKHIFFGALVLGDVLVSCIGAAQFFGYDFWMTDIGKRIIVPESFTLYRDTLRMNYDAGQVYGGFYNPKYAAIYFLMMLLILFAVCAGYVKSEQSGRLWKSIQIMSGTAAITVTVDEINPNHAGAVEASCQVTVTDAQIDIADADIIHIPDQLYTGKSISPEVSVSYNGNVLTEGTDYTITFENNKDIGTAVVTVAGMGSYTGSAQKSFEIYVKEGGSYVVGKQQYTILNANTDGTGSVRVDCAVDKSITAAKIGPTIKIGGKVFRITEIKANAFKGCTELKGATIGNYVTSIGANAFYGCTKLVYAIGAANVTDIGSKAFYNCTSLIKYGNSNNRITAARTVNIGADAFRNCTSVTYVNLSSAALTTIGERAFYGCKSIKTLVMSGKAIKTIGKNAFTNCSSLVSVTIKSDGITSVGAQAFKGIKTTCSFKVPAKKLTEYKNFILKAGAPKTIKVRI